ncbi:MAG: twin-arginine translocase TatA/TatE family subunit [Leptolyngbya sp. PLA3]|nr:MAG: twin-arginine translocase TatA/TatE family subunit [Cyanobacteria bacterium CYA]MCE7968731.1 twin-arginine translocase TatA/TatE family subunit [Leptolyngbya sp. PL-A3]
MTLALLQNIGFQEYLIIAVILLLLFGRRLPEVGRSLGKGIVEFKKGLRDVEEDVRRSETTSSQQQFSSPARPPLGPGGEERRVSSHDEVARSEPSAQ